MEKIMDYPNISKFLIFEETVISQSGVNLSILGHSITFEIEFSRVGESIYSTIKELGLSAGSQDSDEKQAKVKSVMRVVGKIINKVALHKQHSSLDTIFSLEYLGDKVERLNALEKFAEVLKEKKTNAKKFLILEEKVSDLDEDTISYELRKVGEVDDPSILQANQQEILHNSSTEYNKLVIVTDNNWYNCIGIAA